MALKKVYRTIINNQPVKSQVLITTFIVTRKHTHTRTHARIIIWAICKSAPCSRQTTTSAPHHSVFTGRMPFLLPNQQRQSIEGNTVTRNIKQKYSANKRLHGMRNHVLLVNGSTAPCTRSFPPSYPLWPLIPVIMERLDTNGRSVMGN